MEKRFDAETHKYYVGSQVVIGTTTVLERAGLTSDFNKDDVASRFGRIFHDTMKLMFSGKLLKIDDSFKPWMVGIEKFIKEQQPEPYISPERGVERIMLSEKLGYAGALDFFGRIQKFKNRLCLLDWKTWAAANKHEIALAGLQTAGYEALLREEEFLIPILKIPRAVVHFYKEDYRIYDCENPADAMVFRSALNVVKWKNTYLTQTERT